MKKYTIVVLLMSLFSLAVERVYAAESDFYGYYEYTDSNSTVKGVRIEEGRFEIIFIPYEEVDKEHDPLLKPFLEWITILNNQDAVATVVNTEEQKDEKLSFLMLGLDREVASYPRIALQLYNPDYWSENDQLRVRYIRPTILEWEFTLSDDGQKLTDNRGNVFNKVIVE